MTPARPNFPTLYRSEFAYVWKTVRRLGVTPREIEDLVHDVFVVVYRHLGDYDPERPLRPWLFGIAMRRVADHRRALRNVREVVGPAADPADAAPPPDERAAGAEARALLDRMLAGLDLDQRAVFVMHELDEVPIPEVASVLGIPLNTAYSRLRLARAAIAAAVRRFRAGEGRHG